MKTISGAHGLMAYKLNLTQILKLARASGKIPDGQMHAGHNLNSLRFVRFHVDVPRTAAGCERPLTS
jgi:hypothetical protein